jgi:hypothetical protein
MTRSFSRSADTARWLILLLAAWALTAPFFTARSIGGTDARWYAYMIADAADQMRAGQFPVLIGQGTYAWNGGIHPFRTAPIYLWVAEVWNLITLGRLSPVLLQHLTAVTAVIAGELGFYAAAVALVPLRRWEALFSALIYLTIPAWFGLVVWADAYMSFMAFAALPWVLYGNARSALFSDGRGYLALAAGLALVWMCHPPIAALCTLLTLVIQGGAIMSHRHFPWRQAVIGAGWFGLLSFFYFASMSEIPPDPEAGNAARDLVQVTGLGLALVGIGASQPGRRGIRWMIPMIIGFAVLGATSRPWLLWMAATFFLTCLGESGALRWRWFDPKVRAFELVWICALAAAALAHLAFPQALSEWNEGALRSTRATAGQFLDYLNPEHFPPAGPASFQWGWAVWLALGAMAFTFFGSRPLVVKLLFAAAASAALCLFRLPGTTDFLVGYFPGYLGHLCSLAMGLRMVPVIAAFAAMGGFLWLTLTPVGRFPTRGWGGAILAVLVGWGGFQASYLVRWARHQTADSAATARLFVSENAVLDRFVYDLLPLPPYYSNGKMDPLIESRLLDGAGRVVAGPDEYARAMESPASPPIRLIARLLPAHPGWLQLEPGLTIGPGEHVLLRFAFEAGKDYSGYLIMASPHGYREYHLPDSGMGKDHAFGVGPDHGSVLSMWNSGSVAEHYDLTFAKEPGNTFNQDGERFADVTVSKFEPARMAVRLDSLTPYRAVVSTGQAGALETLRAFLPGYRATVDGRAVPVVRSAGAQVQVSVPAGRHTVELRFVGTWRVRLAALVSVCAWVGLGWLSLRGRRRTGPGASDPATGPIALP